MDQETKTYLDQHFARLDERLVRQDERLARQEEYLGRQEERMIRLEERMNENSRQIQDNSRQILGLQDEVRQTRVLVEGVESNVRLVAEGVIGVTERLESFQREVKAGFEDVKASIAPAYQRLDGRVQWLEARAERQTRDVLDVIREKFGKPQA